MFFIHPVIPENTSLNLWLLANKANRAKTEEVDNFPQFSQACYSLSLFPFSLIPEQKPVSSALRMFFFVFFLQSCWARHVLQRQLRFTLFSPLWYKSKDMSTSSPSRPGQRSPPCLLCVWEEWWNLDRFKCIPAFRASKRLWARCFSLLLGIATVASPFFF